MSMRKYILFLSFFSLMVGCSNSAKNTQASGLDVNIPTAYQNDPFNCGSRENVCPGTKPNCCGGTCVDFAHDPQNCNGCGKLCTAGSACLKNALGAGVCTATSSTGWAGANCEQPGTYHCGCHCGDGTTAPATDCVSATSQQAANQACASACSTACSSSSGSLDFCAGYAYSDYRSTCVTLNVPPRSVQCPAGYTSCNGRCVYMASDYNNCGACGFQCGDGQQCGGGACCPKTFDLQSDPNNCGACGNVCLTSGESCSSGLCVTVGNDTICPRAAALKTLCPDGAACNPNGKCTPSCTAAQIGQCSDGSQCITSNCQNGSICQLTQDNGQGNGSGLGQCPGSGDQCAVTVQQGLCAGDKTTVCNPYGCNLTTCIADNCSDGSTCQAAAQPNVIGLCGDGTACIPQGCFLDGSTCTKGKCANGRRCAAGNTCKDGGICRDLSSIPATWQPCTLITDYTTIICIDIQSNNANCGGCGEDAGTGNQLPICPATPQGQCYQGGCGS